MRVPSLRWTNSMRRVTAIAAVLVAIVSPSRGGAEDYTNRVGLMLGGGAYKLIGGN